MLGIRRIGRGRVSGCGEGGERGSGDSTIFGRFVVY